MRRSMAFTQARNKRIAAYATSLTKSAGEPLGGPRHDRVDV